MQLAAAATHNDAAAARIAVEQEVRADFDEMIADDVAATNISQPIGVAHVVRCVTVDALAQTLAIDLAVGNE